MTSTLRHRGSDSGNVWIEDESVLALGHRRLAIIDLSPEGCQPMRSASGRYVMAFNGEVYNFAALRAELAAPGHSFFSSSDTEVRSEEHTSDLQSLMRNSYSVFC